MQHSQQQMQVIQSQMQSHQQASLRQSQHVRPPTFLSFNSLRGIFSQICKMFLLALQLMYFPTHMENGSPNNLKSPF